jgi:hypothetical protein
MQSGNAHQRHRRRLLERQVGGLRGQRVLRHAGELGEGATSDLGVDLITGPDLCDPAPDRFDPPREGPP